MQCFSIMKFECSVSFACTHAVGWWKPWLQLAWLESWRCCCCCCCYPWYLKHAILLSAWQCSDCRKRQRGMGNVSLSSFSASEIVEDKYKVFVLPCHWCPCYMLFSFSWINPRNTKKYESCLRLVANVHSVNVIFYLFKNLQLVFH